MDPPSVSPPLTGFNNNVRYRGMRFHIQTEDSGVTRPHIITQLFADGGHVIKSLRIDYAEYLDHPDRPGVVMRMMREQHRNMALDLRDGRLDETIDRLNRLRAAQEEEEQQESSAALSANGSGPSSSDPTSAPPATVVSGRNGTEPQRDSEAPARNRRPSRAPDAAKKRRSVAPKPRRSQPPARKKLGRSTLLATKPSADSIFGAAPQESLDDVILGYVSHAKNDPDPRGRK